MTATFTPSGRTAKYTPVTDRRAGFDRWIIGVVRVRIGVVIIVIGIGHNVVFGRGSNKLIENDLLMFSKIEKS